jgi:hypothetical protein
LPTQLNQAERPDAGAVPMNWLKGATHDDPEVTVVDGKIDLGELAKYQHYLMTAQPDSDQILLTPCIHITKVQLDALGVDFDAVERAPRNRNAKPA